MDQEEATKDIIDQNDANRSGPKPWNSPIPKRRLGVAANQVVTLARNETNFKILFESKSL